MRDTAELWANARNRGQPTAHDHAIVGDVILAAEARAFPVGFEEPVVVATTKTTHLGRYATAEVWGEL